MSRLLSGVRSSCDMLARNSDLYLEVSASCLAFSSSAWRACSTSWFLRSTSWFWWASRPAFSCNSWLVFCNSSWRVCSCWASDCDCLSKSSVRHVGLDRVEHDADALGQLVEERLVRRVEALERRQLQHALDLALEDDRQDDDVLRGGVAEAGRDADVVRRHVGEQDLLLFQAHWPISPSPRASRRADGLLALVGVAGQQRQAAAGRRSRRGRRRPRAGRRRPAPARRG